MGARARLRVVRIKSEVEEEARFAVVFRWAGTEVFHMHDVREARLDTITDMASSVLSGEMARKPEEAYKAMSQKLRVLGKRIRDEILFCSPEKHGKEGSICPVKELFENFDHLADQMIRTQSGIPELVIESNEYAIPWQLGYAPEVEVRIVDKYAVALVPYPELESVEKVRVPLRVLLITKPSWEDFGPESVSELPDGFAPEMESLARLKQAADVRDDVELKWVHGVSVDIDELVDELQKGCEGEDCPYDVIVFVGRCDPQGRGLRCHAGGGVDTTLTFDEIDIPPSYPLYFLDACRTAIARPEHDIFGPARRFLREGAGVFVGTWQQVDVVAGHAFARHFLEALLFGKTSVARALHLANRETKKQFSDEGGTIGPADRVRNLQASLYAGIGREESIMFSSGMQPYRSMTIVWPEVMDEYYQGVLHGVVAPESIAEVHAVGSLNFDEIEGRLRGEAAVPPEQVQALLLADMPIVRMADLINRDVPGRYAIIGSMFTPKRGRDDCGIFIDDSEVKALSGQPVMHGGDEISVTTFFRLLFQAEKAKAERKRRGALLEPVYIRALAYSEIEENLWRLLGEIGPGKLPIKGWLLAGGRYFAMGKAVSRFKKPLKKLALRDPTYELLRTTSFEGVNLEELNIALALPATLLVARYDEVLAQPKAFYDFLCSLSAYLDSRWKGMLFEVDSGVYGEEHGISRTRVWTVHDKTVFLDPNAIRSTIYFTRLVRDTGLQSLREKNRPLVERPLTLEDFFPLSPIPETWETEQLNVIKEELQADLEDYKKHADGLLKEARDLGLELKEELKEEYEAYIKLLGMLEEATEQGYQRRKREIEDFSGRSALNVVKFRIAYNRKEVDLLWQMLLATAAKRSQQTRP